MAEEKQEKVRDLRDPPMIEKVQEVIERLQTEQDQIQQENRTHRKSPYLQPAHSARGWSTEMRYRRHAAQELPHMVTARRGTALEGKGDARKTVNFGKQDQRNTQRPNDTVRNDRSLTQNRVKRHSKTTGELPQNLSNHSIESSLSASSLGDVGKPYCSKQPYVSTPGAKKEGVLNFPHGRFFDHIAQSLAAEEPWAEESVAGVEEHVTLENFEGSRGCINSPYSIQAMRTFGALQDDITPRDPAELLAMCDGDPEIAALREDFEEKTRRHLLQKLRRERERYRDVEARGMRTVGNAEVERLDLEGGEEPGESAAAFLALTSPEEAKRRERREAGAGEAGDGRKEREEWEGMGMGMGVGMGSPRGSRGGDSRRGGTASDASGEDGRRVQVKWEVGAERMERLMHKADRIESLQLRRMSALLRSHIASKDRMEDLQEKLQKKFDYKAELLEQQRLRVREEREKKFVLSEQRRANIRMASEKAYEVQMVRRQEKISAAEALQREATDRVKQKVRVQAEVAKMKHQRHLTRVLMANRADEYRKEQIVDRIVRQQHQQLALERQLAEVRKNTVRRQLKMQERKDAFMAVVQTYRDTGSFDTTGGLDGVKGLLDFNPHVAPVEEVYEDLNPEALPLADNRTVEGSVLRGRYVNFKLLNQDPTSRICVTLRSREGDPDLYIGNHLCPNPTRDDFTWSKADRGDDRVTIHSFDQGFIVGYFYIAVHGLTDSKFTLTARAKADRSKEKHLPRHPATQPLSSPASPTAPGLAPRRRRAPDTPTRATKLAAVPEVGQGRAEESQPGGM